MLLHTTEQWQATCHECCRGGILHGHEWFHRQDNHIRVKSRADLTIPSQGSATLHGIDIQDPGLDPRTRQYPQPLPCQIWLSMMGEKRKKSLLNRQEEFAVSVSKWPAIKKCCFAKKKHAACVQELRGTEESEEEPFDEKHPRDQFEGYLSSCADLGWFLLEQNSKIARHLGWKDVLVQWVLLVPYNNVEYDSWWFRIDGHLRIQHRHFLPAISTLGYRSL